MPNAFLDNFFGQLNTGRQQNLEQLRMQQQKEQFMQQFGLQRDQFNTQNAHWDQARADEQARQAQQDAWTVLRAKGEGIVQDAPSIQLPGMVQAPTEGQPWLGMNPNDAQGAPILPQSGPAMGSVPEFFGGGRVEAPNPISFGGSKVTFVSPEQHAQTNLNAHLQQFIGEHAVTQKLQEDDRARKLADIDANPNIPQAYKDRFKTSISLGIPFDQAITLKDDLRDAYAKAQETGDFTPVEKILTLMDKVAQIENKYKSNPWDSVAAARFNQDNELKRNLGNLADPSTDPTKADPATRVAAKITELKSLPGYFMNKDLQRQVGDLEQARAQLLAMPKQDSGNAFSEAIKAMEAADAARKATGR